MRFLAPRVATLIAFCALFISSPAAALICKINIRQNDALVQGSSLSGSIQLVADKVPQGADIDFFLDNVQICQNSYTCALDTAAYSDGTHNLKMTVQRQQAQDYCKRQVQFVNFAATPTPTPTRQATVVPTPLPTVNVAIVFPDETDQDELRNTAVIRAVLSSRGIGGAAIEWRIDDKLVERHAAFVNNVARIRARRFEDGPHTLNVRVTKYVRKDQYAILGESSVEVIVRNQRPSGLELRLQDQLQDSCQLGEGELWEIGENSLSYPTDEGDRCIFSHAAGEDLLGLYSGFNKSAKKYHKISTQVQVSGDAVPASFDLMAYGRKSGSSSGRMIFYGLTLSFTQLSGNELLGNIQISYFVRESNGAISSAPFGSGQLRVPIGATISPSIEISGGELHVRVEGLPSEYHISKRLALTSLRRNEFGLLGVHAKGGNFELQSLQVYRDNAQN